MQLSAQDTLDRSDHVDDLDPALGANVEHLEAGQSQHLGMGGGEVVNVDEVPHLLAFPVERDWPAFERRTDKVGNRVAFRLMAFARAIGIEVAEQYDIESEAEVVGRQAGLHRQFGCAVWIERDRGIILQDRQPLRHAVDRRRGGEDDLLHTSRPHRLCQPDAIDDIVLGEQERV